MKLDAIDWRTVQRKINFMYGIRDETNPVEESISLFGERVENPTELLLSHVRVNAIAIVTFPN